MYIWVINLIFDGNILLSFSFMNISYVMFHSSVNMETEYFCSTRVQPSSKFMLAAGCWLIKIEGSCSETENRHTDGYT